MTPVRRLILILFALGLIARLAFALLPLNIHLILLEDDAWMVASIARNFVAGLGITADGLTPTNGFHPLYPLTLGALPWLIAPGDLDRAFQLSLCLTAILNALTIFPLYGLARHFTDESGALVVAALFALNLFLVRVSVNAMETSLGLFLLTLLFYAYYTLDRRRWQSAVLLAGLTVLASLARLDALLAFAAIGLIEGARSLALLWRNRDPKSVLYWSGYGILVLVLLAPYFIFNLTQFGSLQPSSSRALAYLHSYAESFSLTTGVHILFGTPALDLVWIDSFLIKLVLLIALGGLVIFLLTRAERRALAPLGLFVLLTILYYGYLLQHNVSRYYVGISIPLMVLIGMLARRLWLRYPHPPVRIITTLVLLAILFINTQDLYTDYTRAANSAALTQPAMYQTALWIRANLPPGTRLGAVNSGIYQYYSGHVVINLDGKLNMDMVPVFEKQGLLTYLKSKGIEYVVDTNQGLQSRFALYDASFSNAPPHYELSILDRVLIYARLIGQGLGLPVRPALADNKGYQLIRPLSAAMTLVYVRQLPNDQANQVTIYQLK